MYNKVKLQIPKRVASLKHYLVTMTFLVHAKEKVSYTNELS